MLTITQKAHYGGVIVVDNVTKMVRRGKWVEFLGEFEEPRPNRRITEEPIILHRSFEDAQGVRLRPGVMEEEETE